MQTDKAITSTISSVFSIPAENGGEASALQGANA
jgi:hypothetical protein